MVKNTLLDLNNHLFESLERLNDENLTGENLESEISRAKAITGLATQIIANGNLVLKAKEMQRESLGEKPLPPMLSGENESKNV